MKNVLDFVRLCKEKNIPYLESGHHHCHEGWVQTHCPFCTDGTHGWHLGCSLEGGNFNCWRCGGKSIWDVLAKILPPRDKHNLKGIVRQYSSSLPQLTKKKVIRKRSIHPPPRLGPLHQIHKRYLRSREFDPTELEKRWDLQGTRGLSGEWSYRIVTPIKNVDGTIVAYTGRAIREGKKPKWKTSQNEEMLADPNTLLYGVEKTDGEQVLVVEGPSDVWRLGPGAVALLGIDWKEEQAGILRRYEKRYILFDPDPNAQRQARGLAAWLAAFPGETEIISGLPCDPGAIPQREAKKMMRELGF